MIDKIKNYTSINKYDIQLLDNIKQVLYKNNFKYMDEYENFLDKSKKMYSIYEEKSKYIFNVNINSSETIEKIIDSAISKGEKVDDIYIKRVLPEKMKWNLEYIEKFNIWEDIKIMLNTVINVIK